MTRGGKREGAGRKQSNTSARDHLHVRVTAERLTAYREAAARAGKSLSECVVEQLDAWAALR